MSTAELVLTFSMLQGADVISTRYALARGAVEVNPLYRNDVSAALTSAAYVAGHTCLAKWARKKDPKWEKVVVIGAAVIKGVVIVHNLRQKRR